MLAAGLDAGWSARRSGRRWAAPSFGGPDAGSRRLGPPQEQDQEDAPHHDATVSDVESRPEVKRDEIDHRPVVGPEHPVRQIAESPPDHQTECDRHGVRTRVANQDEQDRDHDSGRRRRSPGPSPERS